MRDFFTEAIVDNYESLILEMNNHPKDRHVLAAAVACRADCVVTFNLKDFPQSTADKYSIAVIGPSTFLKRLACLHRETVDERLANQAEAIGITVNGLLDRPGASVPGFVAAFRASPYI
jgi:hypothetical protein